MRRRGPQQRRLTRLRRLTHPRHLAEWPDEWSAPRRGRRGSRGGRRRRRRRSRRLRSSAPRYRQRCRPRRAPTRRRRRHMTPGTARPRQRLRAQLRARVLCSTTPSACSSADGAVRRVHSFFPYNVTDARSAVPRAALTMALTFKVRWDSVNIYFILIMYRPHPPASCPRRPGGPRQAHATCDIFLKYSYLLAILLEQLVGVSAVVFYFNATT